MQKFREVKLPSGAVLKVQAASFEDAKTLYQAVLEESKSLEFKSGLDVSELLKSLLAYTFASKRIESALWVCFQNCIYNGGAGDLKIDKDTFQKVEAREDYPIVCLEVAEENIRPFTKSLSVVFNRIAGMIGNVQS